MQSTSTGSRSRFGCTTCRRRHRKCDERRPVCEPCRTRGLDCSYHMPLKWTNVGNASSFGTQQPRQRSKAASTRRGTTNTTHTAPPCPASPPSITSRGPPSDRAASLELQSHSGSVSLPGARPPDHGSSGLCAKETIQPLSSLLVEEPQASLGLGRLYHDTFSSGGFQSSQTRSPQWSDQWGDFAREDFEQEDNGAQADEEDLRESHGSDVRPHLNGPDQVSDRASCQNASSPSDCSPWVMNNSLGGLLFQIFQNPGEEIAFSYYLKRVCSCIPAYDCDQNPWRKLALVALSYPVLLHGILSVSTGHMYNYGRSNESLLSSRQSRALKSLRVALDALQQAKKQNENSGIDSDSLLNGGGIFSVLNAREVALASIMTQTSSVLMMGIGSVEVHMKCALHFIQDLGYLRGPVHSIFSRLLIQRFAMVDVVLAHLRFRRPLAPPEFFMYQDNEQLDHTEPSFREMHGCPQRILCFLAQISVLSVDLMMESSSQAQIQAKAYALETELRVWGHRYYGAMVHDDDNDENSKSSWIRPTTRLHGPSNPHVDLETVCECFYWIAHILLLRRVFLDPTKSTRVQLIRRRLFRLMDDLAPGCGPDSSLPFPFYMAAREAVTLEERDWVRRKHAAMMETYRDRSREYMMASTEKIWEKAATPNMAVSDGTPLWDTPLERFIRETDAEASYFMF